ncbi:MAG: redoxin [Rhodobacterales bacterium]|nr:MAG: redoxin [Rhodobacterales bacterium]
MLRFVLFYAALVMGANPALAVDPAVLEGLKAGEMKRLAVHAEPKPVSTATFTDPEGGTHSLADWQGKVVLLNFWSVSCVPCREEMPSLNALEKAMGGADFAVVPVAFGYNNPGGLARFVANYEVDALPVLLDPDRALSAEMGVVAPPVTVLIDREGREVARFIGGADWASDAAKAVIQAVIDR